MAGVYRFGIAGGEEPRWPVSVKDDGEEREKVEKFETALAKAHAARKANEAKVLALHNEFVRGYDFKRDSYVNIYDGFGKGGVTQIDH